MEEKNVERGGRKVIQEGHVGIFQNGGRRVLNVGGGAGGAQLFKRVK